MNLRIFSSTVGLFAALALSACAPHNSAKPEDPADIIGGQPGKISVYGVITSNNDKELHIKSVAGKGKFGQAPEVPASQKAVEPKLPEKTTPAPSATALKKSYAFGCSAEQMTKYLGQDKSDTMDAEELKSFNDSLKSVSAGRVVLCGKDPLKATAQLLINTRELILVDLDLTFSGPAGMIFQAAKLQAVGTNNVVSQAADNTSMTAGGPITLIVTESADLKDATLNLTAKGSSFKAK